MVVVFMFVNTYNHKVHKKVVFGKHNMRIIFDFSDKVIYLKIIISHNAIFWLLTLIFFPTNKTKKTKKTKKNKTKKK